LRETLGTWVGLVASAALYAVFHALAYPPAPGQPAGYWYGFVLPFVAGVFFGGVRAYTGSTRAAILAHVAFGVFAVLKAFALAG
jgi:membrane protease YdiL (CAAX protease family)